MDSITPTPESLKKLIDRKHSGKVVMLNLLKFKPGKAAKYMEYAQHVAPILAKIGARPLFMGTVAQSVIGHDGDWDAIALVEYPSVEAFLGMAQSEEYQKIHHYRDEGLERTELYAIAPGQTPAI